MNEIKEKVAKTFEKIQYESEDLVASLQDKIDTEELSENFVKLKNATTRKISFDLQRIQKEIKQLKEVSEIDAYLDDAKDHFEDFFTNVKEKIEDISNGVDVSEFVENLSEETSDVLEKVTTKVKNLAKEAKLDEKMDNLSDKSSETVHHIKEKTEEFTKEISERSSSILDKLKDKLGK